jgi:hypothetical protein
MMPKNRRTPFMRLTRAVPFAISMLAGALAASGALAQGPPPAASPAPAQDAEQGASLIARAVLGLGGAAAIDGIKTLELRGKGTRTAPSGLEVPIETTTRILYPDRFRQDIKITLAAIESVGAIATVVTDREAFLLAGGDAPQLLPEAQRAALAASFRRNLVTLLRSRKDPSFVAARTGAASIDATPVEVVRVGLAGETMSLAIDPATGRTLRLICANVSPGKGPSGELTILYSDFRQAGPIVYPFESTGTLDGKKVYESKLEAIVVDGPIDEALFTAPKPPVPAAAPATPASGAPASGEAPPKAPAPPPQP